LTPVLTAVEVVLAAVVSVLSALARSSSSKSSCLDVS